jgi:hypothetical protein
VAHLLVPGLRPVRVARPSHARPASGRGYIEPHPIGVLSAVLAQRPVRATRNADGGEAVKGRPIDGGKFRFNVASYLARGSVFPKFLRLGKEHIRS